MFDYYFTFRSITGAQRGERALMQDGISSLLQRAPKKLSLKGCGYALKIHDNDVYAAMLALERRHVEYGKTYRVDPDGNVEEAAL